MSSGDAGRRNHGRSPRGKAVLIIFNHKAARWLPRAHGPGVQRAPPPSPRAPRGTLRQPVSQVAQEWPRPRVLGGHRLVPGWGGGAPEGPRRILLPRAQGRGWEEAAAAGHQPKSCPEHGEAVAAALPLCVPTTRGTNDTPSRPPERDVAPPGSPLGGHMQRVLGGAEGALCDPVSSSRGPPPGRGGRCGDSAAGLRSRGEARPLRA